MLYLLVRWTAQVRNSVDSRCDRLLGMIVISLPLTILTGLSAGFAVMLTFEPWRGGRAGEWVAWAIGIVTGFIAFAGFVAVAAQEILALRQDDRLGSAPVERVVLCPTCQAHLMAGQVICASCGTDLRDTMAAPPSVVRASNPWFWMCAAIPAANIYYWLVFLPTAMLWDGNELTVYTAQSLPPAMLATAFCGFQFLKGLRANYVANVESFYARAAAARRKRKQALSEPAEPIFENGA